MTTVATPRDLTRCALALGATECDYHVLTTVGVVRPVRRNPADMYSVITPAPAFLRRFTKWPLQVVVAQLIWDTMGRPVPLGDALDVLEEQGLLSTRLRGALACGPLDCTFTDAGETWYGARLDGWRTCRQGAGTQLPPSTSRCVVLSTDDGLPYLRAGKDDAVTITFRTGIVWKFTTSWLLGSVEDTPGLTRQSFEGCYVPLPLGRDDEPLQGRWALPGGPAPFTCDLVPA